MYFTARSKASIIVWKQSPGVAGASTATGLSELRPNSASRRSACSALVGMPVDGPARWMSTTTRGSSHITARPIASCFSTKPGPLVVQIASCPAKAAPMAALAAAISSSAWKVFTPKWR